MDGKGESNVNDDRMCINQAQLVLAEKRTSLSSLRTGIAVMALPISVLSFLIVTSEHYSILEVLALVIPLMIITGLLILLGAYLIIRAIVRIHRYDLMLGALKKKSDSLAQLMD